MPRLNSVSTLASLLFAALTAAPSGAAEPASAQLSARDLALINAVTWGANPSSVEAFTALGAQRWLQLQLHPPADTHLPVAAQAQIDALPLLHKSVFDLASKFDAQVRAANQLTDPDQKASAQQAVGQAMNDVARQAATRTILCALYSSNQLCERMTWFWFNHFNIYQYKANLRVLVGDFEDRAIRAHALGHFRDFEATLRHPAMLRYLDNADNAAGHINENY